MSNALLQGTDDPGIPVKLGTRAERPASPRTSPSPLSYPGRQFRVRLSGGRRLTRAGSVRGPCGLGLGMCLGVFRPEKQEAFRFDLIYNFHLLHVSSAKPAIF